MAKKQTRRSISVSRTTYERLKSYCEASNISMSQLVETQVNGFLGNDGPMVQVVAPVQQPRPQMAPMAPRPAPMIQPVRAPLEMRAERPERLERIERPEPRPERTERIDRPAPIQHAAPAAAPQPVPMTSAAARLAAEPPPPIIKPRQETAAPKPAEKRPDQIFTF